MLTNATKTNDAFDTKTKLKETIFPTLTLQRLVMWNVLVGHVLLTVAYLSLLF